MADTPRKTALHAFVAGYPVRHSRSPLIHGHWLKSFGIDGDYRAAEVLPENFADFVRKIREGEKEGIRGSNVTIPHKEEAFRLADHPDDIAKELGAANTLWLEDGAVFATNTDGYGFVSNLDERHPGWDRAGRAVVFGAGGASRAIIQALRNRGTGEIHIVNRSVERAQALRDHFGGGIHAHTVQALPEVMQGAGFFVNTTSLGMDGGEVPQIDFSVLASGSVVTDIVYIPLETPLLRQARDQGLATVDGLGMLLHQAVPGFEKWFGKRPVVDEELRALVIADMERH